jgi:uncharacterized protein (TIGR02996 family)
MTPEDAFVVDILEHPDDDAPRLILADWLEDRGEPGDADRAEFIRVQCRRAHLQVGAAEEQRLRQRAEHLLKTWWDYWARPLGQLIGPSPSEGWLLGGYTPEALARFRRGFVYALDTTAQQFIDHGMEILRLAPLRQVRLYLAGAFARDLAACPHLRWMERIDFSDYFSNPVDAAGMSTLASSPWLGALRGLGLYRNNLGDSGLAALAKAKWLGNLQVLEVGETGIAEAGIRALAQTPHSFRPRCLLLGGNPIGDAGVSALVGSSIVSRLTTLSLSHCNVGPEGARALASSPWLGSLRYLHLDGNPLRDAGALALSRAPWLGRLAGLRINDRRIGELLLGNQEIVTKRQGSTTP